MQYTCGCWLDCVQKQSWAFQHSEHVLFVHVPHAWSKRCRLLQGEQLRSRGIGWECSMHWYACCPNAAKDKTAPWWCTQVSLELACETLLNLVWSVGVEQVWRESEVSTWFQHLLGHQWWCQICMENPGSMTFPLMFAVEHLVVKLDNRRIGLLLYFNKLLLSIFSHSSGQNHWSLSLWHANVA